MNVPADDTRPVTIAVEIAWENAPPRTLGEALSFIRRHLNPEHVFSSAELAGCENWRRFLADLGRELDDAELAEQDAHAEADRLRDALADAELAEQDAHARADRLRDALAERARQIKQLEDWLVELRAAGAPRAPSTDPPPPSVGEATP